MAKSKSETKQTGNGNGAEPMAPFQANEQAATMMRNGAHFMENWMATNQQLARFYSRRFKKDIEALNAFATCRTAEDFSDLWARTASETVHDYADEFDRLLEINRA